MALVKKDKAIVLVSGGMDSCLTAAIAYKKYDLAFLHINYGQRTELRELKAFKNIAKFYNVKEKLIVDIKYLKQIGGSALTDKGINVPVMDSGNKKIPVTYVPFRNANILSIAVSWAEVNGAKKIFIGAVEEDSSGYPDCRLNFFKSFEVMVNEGIIPGRKIKIETPIIKMSKKQIVLESVRIGAPIHMTWSCYKNEDKACGKCDSCRLRLRGFKSAGINDPIPYI